MRKVNEAHIYYGLKPNLVATNPKYAGLVKRIAEASKNDSIVGVGLAIASISYDIYIDVIANKVIDPRDYNDIREDVLVIANELISLFTNNLSMSYKDVTVIVQEALKEIVPSYDSTGLLFFNKITENKQESVFESTPLAEIIYKKITQVVEYSPEKYTYNKETNILADVINENNKPAALIDIG